MAIKKEITSKYSQELKITYWTIGYIEILPNPTGQTRIRYRLDGYTTEEDYRAGKEKLEYKYLTTTKQKTELELWEEIYKETKEQDEFKDSEDLLQNKEG